MAEQPTGTVTMLFTDIEGSTRLLERLGPERYREALDQHRRLMREAFTRNEGYEVDSKGDAFFVAFSRAQAAVAAAGDAQRALMSAEWPEQGKIRVRIGIHTGEPLAAPPKYVAVDPVPWTRRFGGHAASSSCSYSTGVRWPIRAW